MPNLIWLEPALEQLETVHTYIAEGLNADIDGASKKLDLATLEAIALPLESLKAA